MWLVVVANWKVLWSFCKRDFISKKRSPLYHPLPYPYPDTSPNLYALVHPFSTPPRFLVKAVYEVVWTNKKPLPPHLNQINELCVPIEHTYPVLMGTSLTLPPIYTRWFGLLRTKMGAKHLVLGPKNQKSGRTFGKQMAHQKKYIAPNIAHMPTSPFVFPTCRHL
jgi:hypothetical protein